MRARVQAMALAVLPPGDTPRIGVRSVLHEAVRDHVETFLARARDAHSAGSGSERAHV